MVCWLGVPVEGAHVIFRINHGNLVQFGANRVATVYFDAKPAVKRAGALETGLSIGGVDLDGVRFLDERLRGELKIVPVEGAADQLPGKKYLGPQGLGYAHKLV